MIVFFRYILNKALQIRIHNVFYLSQAFCCIQIQQVMDLDTLQHETTFQQFRIMMELSSNNQQHLSFHLFNDQTAQCFISRLDQNYLKQHQLDQYFTTLRELYDYLVMIFDQNEATINKQAEIQFPINLGSIIIDSSTHKISTKIQKTWEFQQLKQQIQYLHKLNLELQNRELLIQNYNNLQKKWKEQIARRQKLQQQLQRYHQQQAQLFKSIGQSKINLQKSKNKSDISDRELENMKIEHNKTKADFEDSQTELHLTKRQLEQTRKLLEQTKNSLEQSKNIQGNLMIQLNQYDNQVNQLQKQLKQCKWEKQQIVVKFNQKQLVMNNTIKTLTKQCQLFRQKQKNVQLQLQKKQQKINNLQLIVQDRKENIINMSDKQLSQKYLIPHGSYQQNAQFVWTMTQKGSCTIKKKNQGWNKFLFGIPLRQPICFTINARYLATKNIIFGLSTCREKQENICLSYELHNNIFYDLGQQKISIKNWFKKQNTLFLNWHGTTASWWIDKLLIREVKIPQELIQQKMFLMLELFDKNDQLEVVVEREKQKQRQVIDHFMFC